MKKKAIKVSKLSLANLVFDTSTYTDYFVSVEAHKGDNAACHLHKIWEDANLRGIEYIKSQGGKFSSVDWVGRGFPHIAPVYVFSDKFGLSNEFEEYSCLDVNETLYQYYQLQNYLADKPFLKFCDIGGGYGRFAMGLWASVKRGDERKYSYTTIDYSPLSLWGAPQFVNKALGITTVDCLKRPMWGDRDSNELSFSSVGAWELPTYDVHTKFDVIINTHSMQEMTIETIAFYLDYIERHLDKRGVFYFINQKPTFGNSLADYNLERGRLRIIDQRTFNRLGSETHEVMLQVR